MAVGTKKYFSEASIRENPHKKINLVLRDGAVTTDKLEDKAVTLKKLGEDVIIKIHDGIKIDDYMSDVSENPVQNKVISSALEQKEDLLEYITDRDVSALWGDAFDS